MRVLQVASELAPWVKTGGLGDVIGALPRALTRVSSDVRVATVVPLFREARQSLAAAGQALEDTGHIVVVDLAGQHLPGRFFGLAGETGRARTWFLECDPLFDRVGIYDDPAAGRSWNDNPVRFAFLSRGALDGAERLLGGPPDIVHAHDWQTSLALAYLRAHKRALWPHARGLLTIHNLAYQGHIDIGWAPALAIPWSQVTHEGMEYHGVLNLLKGGIAFADAVTTVSPSYADEIRTPARGEGLDPMLRTRPVFGILNGVDGQAWSPKLDPHIAAPFELSDLSGKAACRQALLEETGLRPSLGEPVLGVVSRFTGQKGIDLVARLVPELHHIGARVVVLGTGDRDLEQAFRGLSRAHGWHCQAHIGFDDKKAHRIFAGCDALLMPSLFEPCGLNQLYAKAYGTVPIVHATGGLRDTVHDPGDHGLSIGMGTGFRFDHPTLQGLAWAVRRATGMYRHHPEGWGRIMRAAMASDHTWARSAGTYLQLYSRLVS